MRFLIVFVILMLGSCTQMDFEYVKAKEWNYDSGFRVGEGDYIIFKNDQTLLQLKQDTIFYKGNPKAIIIKLDKEYFNLIIKSVATGEIGMYRNDEESLQ